MEDHYRAREYLVAAIERELVGPRDESEVLDDPPDGRRIALDQQVRLWRLEADAMAIGYVTVLRHNLAH